MMSRNVLPAAAIGVAVMSSAARADVVQFLATDGNRLYRGDLSGTVQPFVTLSAVIQSLTRVPEGYSVAGASAGDIIATAADPTNGLWRVYRLDDPFGTPTLTDIGGTTFGVGSMAFSPSGLYAVNDSANPIRVSRLDTVNLGVLQNLSTGVSVSGGGGIAYDDAAGTFFLTDATNNLLMRWGPGGNATSVGPVGMGFANNGLEFLNGTLYGAIRLDSPGSQMRVGTFNTATGAFTSATTITGVLGNGTGFVTIPGPWPATGMLVGIGGLLVRRRCGAITGGAATRVE